MTESTAVSLNLQSPNISTVVYAVQNDRSARHIVAQLRDGSSPWTPPYGAAAIIRYLKPDGTGGFYDTDDNNNSAVTITGSVADLTLVEQTLTVPGDVYMQLNFYATDGTRLTSFAWILRVQPSVLADAAIVSSDYFNALTAKIAEGAAVAAQLTFPVPVENGGTGSANAAGARTKLGLGSVATENIVPIAKGGTNANNIGEAVKNLLAFNLGVGTQLSSSDDLDDFTTPGVYYCSSSGTAALIGHTPFTDVAFKLVVMRSIASTRVIQIAYASSATQRERRRYGDISSTPASWSTEWQETTISSQANAAAIAALGSSGLKFSFVTISNNASGTLTVGDSARGVLLCSGPATAGKGIYIFSTNSSGGSQNPVTVTDASGVSWSISNGVITVANSSGYAISAMVLFISA